MYTLYKNNTSSLGNTMYPNASTNTPSYTSHGSSYMV